MNAINRARACVIGWPVKHSRSPLIHGYWLQTHEIDGVYEKAAVAPAEFAAFICKIGVDGFRGANVTVPHKEAAFALCDLHTDAAQAMGAVNTLWREGGKLCGDNTDARGFLASLDEETPTWREETKSALILGSGGAARAIAYALVSSGVAQVTLINRTLERARALAAAYAPRVGVRPWSDLLEASSDVDLLVNATSLGMSGQPSADIDLSRLKSTAIVADIVYVPLRTALIERARASGLRAVGGLGMLLHQAAPGFERWFGARPSVTAELRKLVEADILAGQVGGP